MARFKPLLCFKDVPLLVGFGTSSEVGELAGHSHCFSEDSEADGDEKTVAREDVIDVRIS